MKSPGKPSLRRTHRTLNTSKGWLRCETAAILGVWQPPTRCSPTPRRGLDLPTDVGMDPARYGVHVEARRSDGTRYTLFRLGPYTQTWLVGHDADRLNSELAGKAATVVPGFTAVAKNAPFDVSDHESYDDPYKTDATVLLAPPSPGGCRRDQCPVQDRGRRSWRSSTHALRSAAPPEGCPEGLRLRTQRKRDRGLGPAVGSRHRLSKRCGRSRSGRRW
ncbi:hypothetical protein PV367_00945 [Streptomyces europaeiscabiei]|uniref:Uncharacterized protein n=1 Tax=Streptomyces europaeiscabiei TaxID=146819 RepID=A0AAJ2UJC2_9ACTN|nr:hypothetical protein [Streptomyces europaeiscabiei]MDX3128401.1 hypothetical protein [Streptomyces europaeiscabiei]